MKFEYDSTDVLRSVWRQERPSAVPNKISKHEEIPDEWQEGEIITIYKEKETKGKCSNKRGITLSSKFGKLYERIINERAKENIKISDAQAGGKKEAQQWTTY